MVDLVLEQRRRVAEQVAQALGEHPAVASVLVFGSVATATVDEYSDVDIFVICQPDLIAEVERNQLLSAIGTGWTIGVTSEGDLFPVGDEDGRVNGIPVTIHYQTVSWIEAVLSEVLDYGAITTRLLPFRPYTLPALLQRSWLLYDGSGHVAHWRHQAEHYPALLKQNIIEHFAPILSEETEELVAAAQRSLGPANFLFHLNRSRDALISILYALNELYDPADRRAAQNVWPLLKIAPLNFVPHLKAILEGPFDAEGMKVQARRYTELVDELGINGAL